MSGGGAGGPRPAYERKSIWNHPNSRGLELQKLSFLSTPDELTIQ
jgi:hypothetical protein